MNRPLIGYYVDYLARHGANDITVNLHHQPDSIREALGDGSMYGVSVHYSLEEEILGTSGALDRVRERFTDDDFVVVNGKIVTDIDLEAAVRAHRERNAIATLVLKSNTAREHFSIVEVDEAGCISRFAGFPQAVATLAAAGIAGGHAAAATEGAPLMFTGIQVLSPRIFEYIPRDRFSHSTIHVYPQAIEAGETVLGHISDGDWFELSTLDRYLDASLIFLGKQGRSVIEGAGCRIEDGAAVESSVLWDRVTVESGARVCYSVLADDVRIPRGMSIERAIVVPRAVVREVERGEVIGENLIVPL
jgi:NDP-sugar pyrophosphorylase family protein